MSQYRRAKLPGGTFFFTVVTFRRQPFLCDEDVRTALRKAIRSVRDRHPFTIDGWVLLPDHLHTLWTLPAGDSNFSLRWNLIKRMVTRECAHRLEQSELMSSSKHKHRESTLWQRRFWEHQIRNDRDYQTHMDYLHFNPVKHGYVKRVVDWSYSSFHRHVKQGVYSDDWGSGSGGDVLVGEPI